MCYAYGRQSGREVDKGTRCRVQVVLPWGRWDEKWRWNNNQKGLHQWGAGGEEEVG